MSKTIHTVLSSLALSAGLAASVQANDLPTPAPVDQGAEGCRLIVTDETKKQYPQGLLEFAAKNCWAGQAADMVIIGKEDVLRGDRNHMMPGKATIELARRNLLNLFPQDLRDRFTAIELGDQAILTNNLLHAALSPSNSGAFKFRFTGINGQPDKDVFVTVTDDIYHVYDQMAQIAGIYRGSYINPALYESLTDRDSMRAKTLAHEAGHGKNNDSLKVITNNRIDMVRSKQTTDLDRLRGETGADRIGNVYIAEAQKAGIEISAHASLIDHSLRALSAYFSYGTEVPRGVSLDKYDREYAKAYVKEPNPLPHHATSAGLMTSEQPDAAAQAKGVLEFRAAMNETLGKLFYDSKSGQTYAFSDDIEKGYRRDIDWCEGMAQKLPAAMQTKNAKAPFNAATLVGECLAHGTFTRSFAVNALIELEDQKYVPRNQYAQTYLSEFSEVLRVPIVSPQFLTAAAHYYIDHQRNNLQNPEIKARWDKLFVDQGLMKVESAPAPTGPQ